LDLLLQRREIDELSLGQPFAGGGDDRRDAIEVFGNLGAVVRLAFAHGICSRNS